MNELSPWTESDLKQHAEFDNLLDKHASWNLSTKDAVTLYRCLAWYVQLKSKIDRSIVEIPAPKSPEQKKVQKPKKSTKKESK